MNIISHYIQAFSEIVEEVYPYDDTSPWGDFAFPPVENDISLRNKVGYLLRVIDTLFLPEKVGDIVRSIIYTKDPCLPFDSQQLKLTRRISEGGQNEIYFLEQQEPNNPSYVLKILKPNNKDGNYLELLKHAKDDFTLIKEKFSVVSGLVPDEYFLLIKHYKTGKPVGVSIQEYFRSDLIDVFTEIDKESLLDIIKNEPEFRNSLLDFIKVFNENKDLFLSRNLDICGIHNMCIVETQDGLHKLLLLDAHFRLPSTVDDNSTSEIEQRINYLQLLLSKTYID